MGQTLSALYTVNHPDLIAAVVGLWQGAARWAFQADQGSAEHVDALLHHLHSRQGLLPHVLVLMLAFAEATGVLPWSPAPFSSLLGTQIWLLGSMAPAEISAAGSIKMQAVDALHHMMKMSGHAAQLVQAEQALQPVQQGASEQTLPALFSFDAAASSREHQLYALQVFHLFVNVLQHSTLDSTAWDGRSGAAAGSQMLQLLSSHFLALGGNMQQLGSCLMCTLDSLLPPRPAEITAGNTQPHANNSNASTAKPGAKPKAAAVPPVSAQLEEFWSDGGQKLLRMLSQLPGLRALVVALMASRGGCEDKAHSESINCEIDEPAC